MIDVRDENILEHYKAIKKCAFSIGVSVPRACKLLEDQLRGKPNPPIKRDLRLIK